MDGVHGTGAHRDMHPSGWSDNFILHVSVSFFLCVCLARAKLDGRSAVLGQLYDDEARKEWSERSLRGKWCEFCTLCLILSSYVQAMLT